MLRPVFMRMAAARLNPQPSSHDQNLKGCGAKRAAIGTGGVSMSLLRAYAFAATVLATPLLAHTAAAQTPSPTEKLNAYVGCINRLSERAYDSRARYFSWVGKDG